MSAGALTVNKRFVLAKRLEVLDVLLRRRQELLGGSPRKWVVYKMSRHLH